MPYAQQLANALGNLTELTGRPGTTSSVVYAPDGYLAPNFSFLHGGFNPTITKRDGTPGEFVPFCYAGSCEH
jgi:hypothetical protein